ncbi:MAG TPA: hypothetical protein VGQ83_41595 [Polyangia bacterium]|jgi:hypothetical protein
MRSWLCSHRFPLSALAALLTAALAAGPAWAQPVDPDDQDVPAPPPPPPAPAAPAGYGAAPPVVVLAPGQYAYIPGGVPQVPPHILWQQGAAMRSTGRFLTLGSIALFAIGVGLIVNAANQCHARWDGAMYSDGCPDEHGGWIAGGALSIVGSMIGLGVGIPFWAVGAHRMNRAERMGYVPAYAAAPYVAPTSGGLVAGLRVTQF